MSNYQYEEDFSAPTDLFAAAAAVEERTAFIFKTYLYLFGAIAALVMIETALFSILGIERMIQITGNMFGGGFGLVVIGAFLFVSWIADKWAMNAVSPAMQHAGLGIYVIAQSVILMPLLCLAQMHGGEGIILSAATATGGLFAMLTLTVFITRKDFSFLRAVCVFGGMAALGFIIAAVIFGFELGPMFTYAMIALACCYILYDTSNVLHHYRIGQHVAAALALFASVVILFYYILRLLSSRD